jgi:hypothetical protein
MFYARLLIIGVYKRPWIFKRVIKFKKSVDMALGLHEQSPSKDSSEDQFSFAVAQQPKSGLGRLLLEVSRSHSDTPHSVGLLWTNDQSLAETSP